MLFCGRNKEKPTSYVQNRHIRSMIKTLLSPRYCRTDNRQCDAPSAERKKNNMGLHKLFINSSYVMERGQSTDRWVIFGTASVSDASLTVGKQRREKSGKQCGPFSQVCQHLRFISVRLSKECLTPQQCPPLPPSPPTHLCSAAIG